MVCGYTTYFYARKIAREDGLDDQKPPWFGGWRNVSKINTILKLCAQKGDRLAANTNAAYREQRVHTAFHHRHGCSKCLDALTLPSASRRWQPLRTDC
jgi:Na+-translocating ferredoxin:NAD+ oxidoreductase RNF subunit RnfB